MWCALCPKQRPQTASFSMSRHRFCLLEVTPDQRTGQSEAILPASCPSPEVPDLFGAQQQEQARRPPAPTARHRELRSAAGAVRAATSPESRIESKRSGTE
jgi:hypothetical protein